MKKLIFALLAVLLFSQISEARVGSGRTFGNRGSRGFSSPYNYRNSGPSRSYETFNSSRPYQSIPSGMSQAPSSRGSLLKSVGAGLAGGFLGSMLFRSLGGGYGAGFHGGGGIGPLEILLLGGLLFLVFRLLTQRTQPSTVSSGGSSNANYYSGGSSTNDGAASLMRQAKSQGWSYSGEVDRDAPPIPTEEAMDVFFIIQGAWKTRDLSGVSHLLDADARSFLDAELSQLKALQRINCLENIAVRNTEVVESWSEAGRSYSTVRFQANLLDYTIDERTQQVVEGSKQVPVKFEELWTFSKDAGNQQWKLSAIQQV